MEELALLTITIGRKGGQSRWGHSHSTFHIQHTIHFLSHLLSSLSHLHFSLSSVFFFPFICKFPISGNCSGSVQFRFLSSIPRSGIGLILVFHLIADLVVSLIVILVFSLLLCICFSTVLKYWCLFSLLILCFSPNLVDIVSVCLCLCLCLSLSLTETTNF